MTFFYQFLDTHVCNLADDTTLTLGGANIEEILMNLENDTLSAILWFENNYMKLNEDKCHFLTSGNIEQLWVRVGQRMIWESHEEKLLGIIIDKDLNFNSHLKMICKKAKKQKIIYTRGLYG